VQDPPRAAIEPPIAATGAHVREEPSHAADRRSVRAAVVVDDDDETARVVVGDVVERLPRHPAGQRAVADDRDDRAIRLTGHGERPRDAVRPGQRGGGVRGLHDVVL